MKLFKANTGCRGEVTALLLPPAIATHRSSSHLTESLELTCNFGILGQVLSLPPPLSLPSVLCAMHANDHS
eukprot:6193387-Pleurochrysis_carterae.AAC.6